MTLKEKKAVRAISARVPPGDITSRQFMHPKHGAVTIYLTRAELRSLVRICHRECRTCSMILFS